ncbi:MAG TPA: hypothetical protein VGB73_19665 [Pyrinomonadaceae bacterium]
MATLAVNQLPLAPLGAGDLIDRTVRLYRQHFLALIRASAPPVIVSAAGAVLWVIGVRAISVTESGGLLALYVLSAAVGLLLIAVGHMMHLVIMGGATYTLVRHLLWNEPVTTKAIFRIVRARFWKLLWSALVVALWLLVATGVAVFAWYLVLLVVIIGIVASIGLAPQSLLAWVAAAIGILFVLASMAGALWLFFLMAGRAAYVPQVLLVEGTGVFAAIGRSAQLARGNIRRLMAMFLFTTFATYSALMLLLIPLGWYGYLNGIDPFGLSATEWPMWYAIGRQVLTQSSTILLTPVWMLGLSLLYVDERVRHEGYDIELMAARIFGEMPELPAGYLSPLAPAIAAAPQTSTDAPTRPPSNSFKSSTLGL